jgi:hypothetical protein
MIPLCALASTSWIASGGSPAVISVLDTIIISELFLEAQWSI